MKKVVPSTYTRDAELMQSMFIEAKISQKNHNKLLNSTPHTVEREKISLCVFQAIQLNSNGKNCSDWRIYERPGANMMQQIWGSRE